MGPNRSDRPGRRIAETVGVIALVVLLLLGAFVMFAFGTCHDAGGFCAGRFSATHVAFYTAAAVLLGLAAAAATSVLRVRKAALGVAVTGGTLIGIVLAVIKELTTAPGA